MITISRISKASVAHTILEQLGGNKFIAMTGAKNFVSTTNSLSLKLPGQNFTKNGINYVKVELDPNDTYSLTFSKFRGLQLKKVAEHSGVYAEQLQEIFTRETGLSTHL